jgi:hypothetical protein
MGKACDCRVVFSCISTTFPLQGTLQPGEEEEVAGGPKLVNKAGGEPRGCCAWPTIP